MTEDLQRKVLSKNIEIAYTDTGEKNKSTILFIHGLANYHAVWHWNISTLQQSVRCIAIDLPGNGFSSRDQKIKYTIDFYVDTVIEFIKEMKLTHVSLAGHSMGGLIAMKIALNKDIAIEKLILCAPAGFEYYTPHESMLFKSAITMGNFLNLDEAQVAQSVRSSFFKQQAITEKIIQELTEIIQQNDRTQYRSMLEQSIHSMLDDGIFKQLKKIKQETLVFFGENDMLIPNRFLHPVSTKDIAVKATKEMPHATLKTYASTGHFVQIERALEVNKSIIAFVDRT